MAIIGTVSSAIGFGRAPQVIPPPSFNVKFIGNGATRTWNLLTDGDFVMDGNANVGVACVITPSTSFEANVLIWGAGGAMNYSYLRGGVGGGAAGTMIFDPSNSYTLFSGGTGEPGVYRYLNALKYYSDPQYGNEYRWTAVNGGGGAASGIIEGNVFSIASALTAPKFTLDNPNPFATDSDDCFGFSVAISGNIAIVGAYREDDTSDSNDSTRLDSGKAYIYNVVTGKLLYTLNNPSLTTTSAGDDFGFSVAISGDYAVVGAPREDNSDGSTDSDRDRGRAYIFNVTNGSLVATLGNLTIPSTGGSNFGFSVAISDNRVVVGAPREYPYGRVYIYDLTGKLLYQKSRYSKYGKSVAISGNLAIIGYGDDNSSSGGADIYDVITGQLQPDLTYSGVSRDYYYQLGVSVAISETIAAVGAPGAALFDYGRYLPTIQESGKIYVFNLSNKALKFKIENPNLFGTPQSDQFGYSVAISGNLIIVGTRFEDDASGKDSGKVYIFSAISGVLITVINNPNPTNESTENDYFGSSISASGDLLIVGSFGKGVGNSGKSYIYDLGPIRDYSELLIIGGGGAGSESAGSAGGTDSRGLSNGFGGFNVGGGSSGLLFDNFNGAGFYRFGSINGFYGEYGFVDYTPSGGGYLSAAETPGGPSFSAVPTMKLLRGSHQKAPMFDLSKRANAGDSGRPGRIVLSATQYKVPTITATGGTIVTVPVPYTDLSYKYHVFRTSGSFTVSSAGSGTRVDIFVVGGGGGGYASGGGAGEIALANGQLITTGNYLVSVGNGGDAGRTTPSFVGGFNSGLPGEPSSFFTNSSLKSEQFPDSYIELIHSFHADIYYIKGSSGSTSNDGKSISSAWPTIEYAVSATDYNLGPVVFVVCPGTYIPTTSAGAVFDNGSPRIFVCAPNNQTKFEWSSTSTGWQMTYLRNPLSAVYGAVFHRNYSPTTGTPYILHSSNQGRFYNCVFQEDNPTRWSLSDGDIATRLQYCTIVVLLGEPTGIARPYLLLENCIVNQTVKSAFASVDTTTGVTGLSTTTYKSTTITDRGVFAGKYSWSSVKTTLPTTSTPLVVVAKGGGGGVSSEYFSREHNYYISYANPEMQGGGGGGGGGTYNYYSNYYTRPPGKPTFNANVNLSYSFYSYAGEAVGNNRSGFGGGTDISVGIRSGGLEWPSGYGDIYGIGGQRNTNLDYFLTRPGRGGDGGGVNNMTLAKLGQPGAVIVRYLVQGTYTEPSGPALPPVTQSYVDATGGVVTITPNYVQHVFTRSGQFTLTNALQDTGIYLDVLLVGGGGGGAGGDNDTFGRGGYGGSVRYYRLTTLNAGTYNVTVGNGGAGGIYYEYSHYGEASYFGSYGAAGGAGVNPSYYTNSKSPGANGTLITNGLFSDNTTRYGASGGDGSYLYNASFTDPITPTPLPGGSDGGGTGGVTKVFNYYSGGTSSYYWAVNGNKSIAATDGVNNTGSGGGGGGVGAREMVAFSSPSTLVDTTRYNEGGRGGSGIVIIRYLNGIYTNERPPTVT